METTPDQPMGSVSLDTLLEHADWVRALARRLVRDAGQAEDAVQETWVEAVSNPPAHGDNGRSGLATVLRNAVRRGARGEGRRAQREAAVARDEAQLPDGELVERARLQRELAGHVLELREPYRSVLLLRWFEGLAPAEIAARTGAGPEAVHSRLRRGHALLRERLDADYGDRSSWCAALAALAEPLTATGVSTSAGIGSAAGSSLPKLLSGTGFMITIATGSLVALGLAAALTLFDGDPVRSANASPAAAESSTPDDSHAVATLGRSPATTEQDSRGQAQPAVLATTPWTVQGSVTGAAGGALAGAGIEAFMKRGGDLELLGTTAADASGSFRFDLLQLAELTPLERLPAQLELRAWAAGHQPETILTLLPQGEEAPEPIDLVLPAGVLVTGRVVDATGAPVEGAFVSARHVASAERRSAELEQARQEFIAELQRGGRPDPSRGRKLFGEPETLAGPRARTDADGRYRIGTAAGGRVEVTSTHPGYGAALVALDSGAAEAATAPDTVLETRGVLAGVLRSPAGAPLAGIPLRAVWAGSQEVEQALDRASWIRLGEDPGEWRPKFRGGVRPGSRLDPASAGLYEGLTVTDEHGRFRFLGLQDIDYMVHVAGMDPVELMQEAVSAGIVSLELETARPSLWVTVRDAEGRALPGFNLQYAIEGGRTIEVVADGEQAAARIPSSFGKRIQFEVSAPGIERALGEALLLEGNYVLHRTLTLVAAEEPGSVALKLTDSQGAAVGAVQLQLERKGALAGPTTLALAPDGRIDALDPGEWAVRFIAEDPTLQPADVTLDVVSGQETTLAVELRRGALLTVLLEDPDPDSPWGSIMGKETFRFKIDPKLLRSDGTTIPLAVAHRDDSGAFIPAEAQYGRILHLVHAKGGHPAFEPGDYTLQVGAFRPVSVPVRLVAGETTDAKASNGV